MKKLRNFVIFAIFLTAVSSLVFSHCQIPCGIYDDAARFGLIREHIQTIEKSMHQIKELSGEKEKNWNQIVRWVNNKEEHAEKLSKIVTYYFMAQRIKPVPEENKQAFKKYQKQLTLLHKMINKAMKAKQTTNHKHVKSLRDLTDKFEDSYMEESEK